MSETTLLTLRKARPDDTDRAVAVIREASDWLAERGITWLRQFPGPTPERVEKGIVWLAYLEGDREPIATIALETAADLEFWSSEESDAIFVHSLAVRRRASGLGVGSRLLEFAGDQASRRGVPWVRLDCNKTNTQLQDYYRTQGFAYLRTVDLPHRVSGALFQKMARRSKAVRAVDGDPDQFTLDPTPKRRRSPAPGDVAAASAGIGALLEHMDNLMAPFRDSLVPLLGNNLTPVLDQLANSPAYSLRVPQIDTSLFKVPQIDPAFLRNPLEGLTGPGGFFETLSNSIALLYRPQWEEIFESFQKIAARIYPENWDGVKKPALGDIEAILLDEGIPLMWVPGPKILRSLLDANDPAARRRVIGQRWRGVLSDCEAALATIDHPDLLSERDFAIKCARALRDGHAEAAQALSANLLDSVLRSWVDKASLRKITQNHFKKTGVKIDLDDYAIREAFVAAPVWHAYAQYRTEAGDPIPSKFARHASVHAVTRRQYTRINAVMGLMLVTSVLKFLDSGHSW